MPRSGCPLVPRLLVPLLLLLALVLPRQHVVASTDCPMEPSAWTLLRFHLNKAEERASHTQIVLDEAALAKLEALNTRLALVSIIGPYRTGKSTLLNQLLPSLAPRGVFSVGHTVQPHTEEVALYPVPPCALVGSQVSLPPNTTLVLLDTPGLFAPNRASLFDAQLLAVLNLVSSVLLYNNFGVIKRGEVEQLSEAVEAAFALSYYDSDGSNDSHSIDRPHLIWCMQNLQVDLRDRAGQDVSTKSYIQDLLTEIDSAGNGTTRFSARFNRFFQSLDASALPFPTESFKDAQRITELADTQLTAEYREARASLVTRVHSLVTPKHLGSNILNGATLASLLAQWVENVNVPTERRQRSASSLLTFINQREVSKAVDRYKSEMRQLVTLPTSDVNLRQAHESAVQRVLARVRVDDLPDFLSSFTSRIDELYAEYVKVNEGNLKELLGTKQTQWLDEWKHRVSKLRSVMPVSVSQIEDMVNEALSNWRSSVNELRTVSPAAVPEYDARIQAAIAEDRRPLLTQSVTLTQAEAIKQCEDKLASITVPTEVSVINETMQECRSQWQQSKDSFSQVDSEALTALSTAYDSAVSALVAAVHSKNEAASLNACLMASKRISRGIVKDSARWHTDPRYQSYPVFAALIDEARKQELCVGPGSSSVQVQDQFDKARREVRDAIEQRENMARVFYAMLALLAFYDAAAMKRLLSAAGGKKPALPLSASHGVSGGGGVSGLSRVLCILSVPLGVLGLLVARSIPGAAPGVWLHLLSGTIGVLFLAFFVYLHWQISELRAKKASHQH